GSDINLPDMAISLTVAHAIETITKVTNDDFIGNATLGHGSSTRLGIALGTEGEGGTIGVPAGGAGAVFEVAHLLGFTTIQSDHPKLIRVFLALACVLLLLFAVLLIFLVVFLVRFGNGQGRGAIGREGNMRTVC